MLMCLHSNDFKKGMKINMRKKDKKFGMNMHIYTVIVLIGTLIIMFGVMVLNLRGEI